MPTQRIALPLPLSVLRVSQLCRAAGAVQVVVPNASKHLRGEESRAALQAEVEPLAQAYVTTTAARTGVSASSRVL